MIEEHAKIVSIHENEVLVEIKRQSSCGSCSAQSNCGTSSLSQLFGQRPSQFALDLENSKQSNSLKEGDEVLIGLEDSSYLKASLFVYLWPILFMLFFAITADLLFTLTDVFVLFFSLFGLWLGYKFSSIKARSNANFLTPHLIKKL